MKKVLYVVVCMVVFLSNNARVNAEEIKPDGTLKLETVVVSAGRIEESRKDLTVGVTVIDSEDIEKSSANDLGDLLSEKGGLYIRKYPGALTAIAIRGVRSDTLGNDLQGKVLVLLDGRRVATGNVAKIATENIERVEIIKGSAAVQYGSAAVGGLVNVITKKGEDQFSFSVNGGVGSYGLIEEGFGFSGKKEKIDLSMSASLSSMNEYRTGRGVTYKNTGYDKKANMSFNLGYEVFPKNRIGITHTFFEADEVGAPSYVTNPDLDDYKDSRNYSTDLTYDGAFGKSLSCKIRYFFGKDTDTFYGLSGHDPSGWMDNDIPSKKELKSKGTQAQISFVKERVSLTTGIDWLNYENESSKYAPFDTEYNNLAVFLLGKANFMDTHLILSAGLRYDEYDVEVINPAGNKEDDTNVTPSFGIAYKINDNFKLRTNYSEAFVMQAADELAANYSTPYGNYIGNPGLDPEKSTTYEVGMDATYKNFSSSLTYFNTNYNDKVETTPDGSGNTTWENLGKATLSGVEGEFSGYIREILPFDLELKPYVVFTYLTEFKDEEADEDLKYTSELDLSSGLSVTDLDGFNADLSAVHVGSQYIIDYQNGTYNRIKLDGSTVLNFTISKTLKNADKPGGLTVRGEIKNIADEHYAYVQGYPLPGRTFCVNLKYQF